MISEQFVKHLVPADVVAVLGEWSDASASTRTRTLPAPLDSRTEFAISSALDVVSNLWMSSELSGHAGGDGGMQAPQGETGKAAESDKSMDHLCTCNIRMLVALLQVRPVIPNSLFAIIFQAIVTIGKISPPSVLLAEHGPLLNNLLVLSSFVPTSIANVARVTARNVARRVSPQMFAVGHADGALLRWITEHIVSLSSCPDAMTKLHNDRKIAVMLIDKMFRVEGDLEPVGGELRGAVLAILSELDATEKQVAGAFLARADQHFEQVQARNQHQSPGPRATAAPWISGDTLGSPLPQLPDGAALRMRESLLTSDSTSRSQSSGAMPSAEAHHPEAQAAIEAVPIAALRQFLLELEHTYHVEMDKYRQALDDERHRRVMLEARLRFVQDEGEEIEREARSQSRAAIAYLTPRNVKPQGGPSPGVTPSKLSPPHERVVDLLVRQCAIHDTLTEGSRQHVAPTVQRLDLAKVSRTNANDRRRN